MDEQTADTPNIQVTKETNRNWLKYILIVVPFLLLVGALGYFLLSTSNEVNKLRDNLLEFEKRYDTLTQENEVLKEELEVIKNPPYFTNYLPVKFRFGRSQKAGQMFLQEKPQTISTVILQGSYGVGGSIIVSIFEIPDVNNIGDGISLTTSKFPVDRIKKTQKFEMLFDKAVDLEGGKSYLLTVESENDTTDAGVAFAEADIVSNGRMYIYSRLIGGNGEIIDEEHSWQPKDNFDLIYTLK